MTSRMKCTAMAVLFASLTGCHYFWAKVKPEPIPTPDPPRPISVTPPPPRVELPPGPPPKIETKQPEVPSAVAGIPTPPAPKPKGKKPPKKPATSTGTAQSPSLGTPPSKEQADATSPSANVPKLVEILSDDQKAQMLRVCDESLTRAREALTQLRGLPLSPDQKQSLGRVRTFIYQAEQAREKDPQTARQMAERADSLSRDLVRTVR
jgi:hypothetical protein